MSRRRISQREARAAIKRVQELQTRIEAERALYSREFPGVFLRQITWPEPQLLCEALWTARKLGWAVVVKPHENRRELAFYAVPRKVS